MKKTRPGFVIGTKFVCAVIGYVCLTASMLPTAFAAEGDFTINPGLNDAWFNPATEGQGFLITVFPESKEVFLAWFTYDTERPPEDVGAFLGEPGHRWLTAQGPYDGDTANLTIFVTEGGVFNAAEPAASTDLAGDGTLTLEFADCTAGLVTYQITSLGISGEIPIQRIVEDNVPLCETLNEQLSVGTHSGPPGLEGITAAHNVVRDSVDVGEDDKLEPLVWDPKLAKIAQEWADKCVDENNDLVIDHNPGRHKFDGDKFVGENVVVTGGNPTPRLAMVEWVEKEKKNYDTSTGQCFLGTVCGHYTQVVWRNTKLVGCGTSQCDGWTFPRTIVCNYFPTGNVTNQRPY